MKYTKGTKLKSNGEELYYVDEIYDDDSDQLILICGGNFGLLQYIPADEVEKVDATYEEKMLDILVDLSATVKRLNENIEQVQSVIMPQRCEGCDDCDCDGSDDDRVLDDSELN